MAAAGLKDLAFIVRIHMKRLHFMKIFETTYTPGVLFHFFFYFYGLKLYYEYIHVYLKIMKNYDIILFYCDLLILQSLFCYKCK